MIPEFNLEASAANEIVRLAWVSMGIYRMRGANASEYLKMRGWVGVQGAWSSPYHAKNYGLQEAMHAEREIARHALEKALVNAGLPVPTAGPLHRIKKPIIAAIASDAGHKVLY